MSTPVVEETSVRYAESDLLDLVAPYEEPTDKNAKAHIVSPVGNEHIFEPWMEGQDVVNHARMHGLEVVALCGYRWVPKHNPDKCEACEVCMRVAGEWMREKGE